MKKNIGFDFLSIKVFCCKHVLWFQSGPSLIWFPGNISVVDLVICSGVVQRVSVFGCAVSTWSTRVLWN